MALLFGLTRPIALGHLVPDDAPGSLAVRHALTYGRPPVWVNNTREPTSILVCRRAASPLHCEIFAAGDPVPALRWIRRNRVGRSISLLAPVDWQPAVAAMVGKLPLTCREVQTWHDVRPLPAVERKEGAGSGVGPRTRMLLRDDTRAFGEIAPDWALKGWQLYDFLTIFGAAFGVPYQGGLAAVAWIYEACPTYDSIGVFTQSRYRRLGLGRAAARALINHIQRVRKKQALWTTQVANEPSVALARLLGFTQYASEMLYEWPSSL